MNKAVSHHDLGVAAVKVLKSQSRNYFTAADFKKVATPFFEATSPTNKAIPATLRATLQRLRDDKIIEFVDNNGTYRSLI